MTATAILTLCHVLVLVYWLGGDLGAFYSSTFLTDPRRSVAERMLALKILNGVDMAPRTALILALPTGLGLACAKGWLALPVAVPVTVAILSLCWLALAWAVHLAHGSGGSRNRTIDLSVRWMLLAAVVASGIGGLTNMLPMPLFVALKLLILASCLGLGLLIRRQLVPLFPAIRDMALSGPTPDTNAVVTGVIARTRRGVVTLWLLLLTAAWLGVATPLSFRPL